MRSTLMCRNNNERNCVQKANDKQNNSSHNDCNFTMLSKTSIPSDDICLFNEL